MKHKSRLSKYAVIVAIICAAIIITAQKTYADTQKVNIYSYRQPFLIEPILEKFTEKTGIQTNILFVGKGHLERVKHEGKNSPADIILTVDIGRLADAVKKGITQPVKSDILEKNIPAIFRDPYNMWFGLTMRARVVYAAKDRVRQNSITYEELANPEWKGRICIRSGQHRYNLALFASLIENIGLGSTKTWLKKLKENLARKPSGNDRLQVKAIYSGECDISLGNTYYMGEMMYGNMFSHSSQYKGQKEWAESVKIIFPNTNDRGTHVNLSGMVMTKYAPNRENALKLMEFLVSEEAQKLYAEANYEYPVRKGIEWSQVVKNWGSFKPDLIGLDDVAKHQAAASKLVDEVDFNN